MDTNTVVLVGRSTKDVELKTTTGGTNLATISLAVNHTDDLTSYFDVVCFGRTAENVAKYVKKGKQVIVSGRLQRRKWQTKDGENRYAVEIIANQVQFVGSAENAQTTKDVAPVDIDDNPVDLSGLDIPFN